MRILMSEVAARAHGEALRAAHDGIELVTMGPDGSLRRGDGSNLEWDGSAIEVAWGTSDLFAPGAPLRSFFGLLRRSETVRWFQSAAAGFDAPIFAELVRKGILLTTSDANSISIAEYVLRSVLEHFQRSALWAEAQAERLWARHDFEEVSGSTWLVVGLGSIGTEVALRARAFGAHVIGVRRHPGGDEPVAELITPDAIDRVLPRADVVVLCAPASASTRHLVNRGFLDAMKRTALLVNVGRGSLVDEQALAAALDAGAIGGAALDVFEVEPLPGDHPWWDDPRVVITPHNSAGGRGRHARGADLFSENLARYRRGEPLLRVVTEADLDG
ncbi:MAG TPA: D-2-hydroxyacid dehydrogenase [Acidimicrobiales bacterium]|nr:D-2-hydroxyacid dehydrogenase [Acidimicrobiales bacterium]